MFWTTVAGAAVYMVGIPAAWISLLVVLYRRRQLFSEDAVSSFGFLFNTYRPDLWLWHVVTIARLIVLEAVAAFYGHGNMEAAWYNSVLFVALALHAWAKPYKQASTNVMGVVSLIALMAGYNSVIEPEKAVEWAYWAVLVMDTVVLVAFIVLLALPLVVYVGKSVQWMGWRSAGR